MKARTRKIIAACLVVIGIIVLLLAPTHNSASGIVLVAVGIAMEVIGITLEKRRG